MIIQHARPADLDGILALERDGFAPAEQWSATSWGEELAADDRCVLTETDADGAVIAVADFACVAEVADLHRIVVHPSVRGRGVAARLIRAGIDWAGALGATRMLLEVRPDNEGAIALYTRLAFDRISLRRNYYGPGLDALIMERPLDNDSESWDQADEWSLARA